MWIRRLGRFQWMETVVFQSGSSIFRTLPPTEKAIVRLWTKPSMPSFGSLDPAFPPGRNPRSTGAEAGSAPDLRAALACGAGQAFDRNCSLCRLNAVGTPWELLRASWPGNGQPCDGPGRSRAVRRVNEYLSYVHRMPLDRLEKFISRQVAEASQLCYSDEG